MSTTPRTPRRRGRRERQITVRAIRRDPPDLRKLSRAIIALAMAQAEAEAEKESHKSLATDDSPTLESDGDLDVR